MKSIAEIKNFVRENFPQVEINDAGTKDQLDRHIAALRSASGAIDAQNGENSMSVAYVKYQERFGLR